MCKLSIGEAQQFYGVHQGKPFYDKLTHFMSAGRIVAMELVRDGECHVPVPTRGLHVYVSVGEGGCVCGGGGKINVCVCVPGCMARTRHADLPICLCLLPQDCLRTS